MNPFPTEAIKPGNHLNPHNIYKINFFNTELIETGTADR